MPDRSGQTFVREFPMRLTVLANRSQANRYVRASARRRERNIVWWELSGLQQWVADNPAPYVVEFLRIGPGVMDSDGLAYAFKGVRDTVAERLGLKSDRDGDGATWHYAQQKSGFERVGGRRVGIYRVRISVSRDKV